MHIECNAQFLVVPSTDMQLCSIKTKSLKQSRGLKLQNILVEVVKVWYIYVLIHTKTKKVFLTVIVTVGTVIGCSAKTMFCQMAPKSTENH